MAKLVLFLPDGTTMNIPLDRERITIGRRADNEICLPNLAVSGEHAAIVTILTDSFLKDVGSTNGTLVNGNPIVKHLLRDRDEIELGRHKLVYCMDDDAVVAPDVPVRIAHGNAGDFGEQVDTAKPSVRSKRAASSPRSKRDIAAEAKDIAGEKARPEAKSDPQPDSEPQPERIGGQSGPAADPVASVKVLTGPGAGRAIPVIKEKTTIGRAGVQVALISRAGSSFHLESLEGKEAPRLNGTPVGSSGQGLHRGDILEIAGTKLQFIVAG